MKLDELNPMQRKAVENTEGPCLVIAGAGSGKTKVLTYKVAYLIEEKNVKPWNILAITFTNKAAKEMIDRVQKLVGSATDEIWLGTFHAICVRILRKFIDRLGFNENFVIFDTTDQKTLVKNCLKELNIDSKLFTEKSVLSEISNAKNEMLEPDEYLKKSTGDYRKEVIGKVYELYQRKLKENNAIDFDDIINFTIRILEENLDILDYYSDKFKYILVDEYQDTNKAQFTLVSILASRHGNVTAVGDNDQGIYSFRGADITNILNFERDFPGTEIIKLEQNYRCTGNILKAANEVIKHNENKYDKKLWTENEEGSLPYLYCGEDEYDEASFIIEKINELKRTEYYKYSDFVVLYRMNAQSRAIEDILRREDIPYKIVGGLKFYERKEIKDIISYLRLIANSSDNLSLVRVINEPKRGVGKTSIENIEKLSIENNTSMYEIIKNADKYLPRIYENTRDFIKTIEELKEYVKDEENFSIAELVMKTLDKTGYVQALKNENTIEAESRLENLEEFMTVAIEFEKEEAEPSLNEFLNGISLSSDTDNLEESDDMVTLMTLHMAKGLEYPAVFLVGLEEGIFPGRLSMDNPKEIEEERRLFYVGITRAKENLFMTFAKHRTIFGSTSYNPVSRFVKEIPEDVVENYENAMGSKYDDEDDLDNSFRDSKYEWSYKGERRETETYKVREKVSTPFGRSADSFLASLKEKPKKDVDLGKFKIGQEVFHKKFGEGIITNLEPEGDDIKVDIEFKKAGHKRLMARFAGLEIVE